MKLTSILLLLVTVTLFVNRISCNYPETVTISSRITLPPDSSVIYQFTRHYFILVPGDTALLYGTRQCTVTVNGIVTSLINDSAYLRTITLDVTTITINDTPHVVHPQLYQQSATFAAINENTITQYFEKTDSATLLIAYNDKGTWYYPRADKQIIMPKMLLVGHYGWFDTDSTNVPLNNTWPTSQLTSSPLFSFQKQIVLEGFSVATDVIALPRSSENPYTINGNNYTDGIFVKTYYTFHDETVDNDTIVDILGTVVITRTYFVRRGLIDQRMITTMQKLYTDGSIEKIRETVYVARGPQGAKAYTDNDIP